MKLKLLAIVVALLAVPTGASANISQQVNEMFSGMINVTSPGAYQTATRGVITGGGVVLRNRITTTTMISITPPSAKGGCGGINLYSGSFSFINGEEFVALMRNVASNAAGIVSGFAFELALDAMDAQTGGVIRNLANKIQSLNQMFSNSCQLASGLVTNAKKAFEETSDFKSAMTSFGSNVSDDFFGAKSTKEDSPANRLASAGKAEMCNNVGNVLWCAMEKSGLKSQILFGSDENAEYILSLVGSYSVSLLSDDKGGKTFGATPIASLIKDKGLKVFIEGSEDADFQVYDCDSSGEPDCLKPEPRDLGSFKGLEKRIIEDLKTNGVLEKFAKGQASPVDGNRIAYLASSRVGINLIKITQKAGAQAGYDYLDLFAKKIAADAALSVILQLIGHTEKGLTSLSMVDAPKVLEELRETKGQVMNEYTVYVQEAMQGKDADDQAAKMLQMAPSFDNGSLPQSSSSQSTGN
ncbi:conjugal transfer protein TraH [Pseudomonas sp. 2FE]|uniref:conjugal transfer protein TraH n=1 Tax=Pseudomonas sp. 2FE TaxID=2502190 RepID=UPI0010F43FDD|nr:conjugal transfer protein TraH [Pseudomonas sp. 2FE]